MTEFVYWIGDVLQWTFKNLLEPLGNAPNILFTLLGIGGFLYWMFVVQPKYNKKAKDSGGLV